MSLFVNGVEINEVFVNGIPADTVFVDGVQVYSGLAPIDPATIAQAYSVWDSDPQWIQLANANQVLGWDAEPVGASPAGLGIGAQLQPFYIDNDPNFGNRPSIDFRDTNRRMTGSTMSPLLVFPATWAFVYKWNNATSSANRMLGWGTLTGGGSAGLTCWQENGFFVFNGVSTGIQADNLAHIIILNINGANSQAWRDGIPGPIFNSNATSWPAFQIANQTGGSFGMLGQMAAWSNFDSPLLTPEERNGIGLFYADRFGLTWNP